MRLIDADALKESLKELKAEGNNRRYVQGLQDAIDDYFPQIIDDAPTIDIDAEPVRHEELWVSCSERLPETLTETLDGRYSDCCLVFAEETEWIGMAYYRTNNSESWWEFADAQNKPKIDWAEITHWMPLPNCPNCGAKMNGGAE